MGLVNFMSQDDDKTVSAVAVTLRSLRFKALSGKSTVMNSPFAFHQTHHSFVPSLDIIKNHNRVHSIMIMVI